MTLAVFAAGACISGGQVGGNALSAAFYPTAVSRDRRRLGERRRPQRVDRRVAAGRRLARFRVAGDDGLCPGRHSRGHLGPGAGDAGARAAARGDRPVRDSAMTASGTFQIEEVVRESTAQYWRPVWETRIARLTTLAHLPRRYCWSSARSGLNAIPVPMIVPTTHDASQISSRSSLMLLLSRYLSRIQSAHSAVPPSAAIASRTSRASHSRTLPGRRRLRKAATALDCPATGSGKRATAWFAG